MAENEILPEEEAELLLLTDDSGAEHSFEYLDCIEYEGKEYLVLLPADEAEEESDEIVILEVQPVDEETENYVSVEDENTLNAVFAIFKERFKDILEFAD